MNIHLTVTLAGPFALDDEGNIIDTRNFELKPQIVSDKLAKLDVGELPKELEDLMRNAIGKKPTPTVKPPEVREIKEVVIKKEEMIEKPAEIQPVVKKVEVKTELFTEKTLKNWTKNELIEYCQEHNINLRSKDTKTEIIRKIIEFYKVNGVI